VPRDHPLPEGYRTETLVPMQGARLPDELLSLGGMAMQALWWEETSGHCPRCGERAERLAGEWGKRCPRCRYEHYPHLHPAVIVLVMDGDRCLLARKAGWAPGRYALVAGFVDNGESFEGTVAREVKEEVGVDVTDIRYVGSQNWPFPSQIMVGDLCRRRVKSTRTAGRRAGSRGRNAACLPATASRATHRPLRPLTGAAPRSRRRRPGHPLGAVGETR
jgi:NADH pyrophosphatase NudC (nudix superfamily)